MSDLDDELQLVVQGLRCDRCGEWPGHFQPDCDAILCEVCTPIRRRFIGQVLRALGVAPTVGHELES